MCLYIILLSETIRLILPFADKYSAFLQIAGEDKKACYVSSRIFGFVGAMINKCKLISNKTTNFMPNLKTINIRLF
jgi:hypothetical protein